MFLAPQAQPQNHQTFTVLHATQGPAHGNFFFSPPVMCPFIFIFQYSQHQSWYFPVPKYYRTIPILQAAYPVLVSLKRLVSAVLKYQLFQLGLLLGRHFPLPLPVRHMHTNFHVVKPFLAPTYQQHAALGCATYNKQS